MIDRDTLLLLGPVFLVAALNQLVGMAGGWIVRREVHRAVQAVNVAAVLWIAWTPVHVLEGTTIAHLDPVVRGMLILVVVRRMLMTAHNHKRARGRRDGEVEVRYESSEGAPGPGFAPEPPGPGDPDTPPGGAGRGNGT